MRKSFFVSFLLLALPAVTQAHAEWFLSGSPAPDRSLPVTFWVLAIIAAAAVFLLRPLAARPVGGTAVKVLHLQMTPFVGLAKNVWPLGLGMLCLAFAIRGDLFSPNIVATTGLDELTRILLLFAGLGFITLLFKRYAAALLLCALAIFWIQHGTVQFFLHAEYAGLGFALLFGYQQKKFVLRYAMRYARIGLGVMLIAAALYEKVFHSGISLAFLSTHAWNFLSGLGVSDLLFISFVAVVELFFGILLAMNIFPRFAALAVLCTFFVTFVLLGFDEFLGHTAAGLIALFVVFFGTDFFHFTEEQEIEL